MSCDKCSRTIHLQFAHWTVGSLGNVTNQSVCSCHENGWLEWERVARVRARKSVKFLTSPNLLLVLKLLTHTARTLHGYKPLLLSMSPAVLCLVRFSNFDRTTGFYWSYTLNSSRPLVADVRYLDRQVIGTLASVNWYLFVALVWKSTCRGLVCLFSDRVCQRSNLRSNLCVDGQQDVELGEGNRMVSWSAFLYMS